MQGCPQSLLVFGARSLSPVVPMGPSVGMEVFLPDRDLKLPLFCPRNMEVSKAPKLAVGPRPPHALPQAARSRLSFVCLSPSIFDREDESASRQSSLAALERRQAEKKKELMKAQSLPKTSASQARKAMMEKLQKEGGR